MRAPVIVPADLQQPCLIHGAIKPTMGVFQLLYQQTYSSRASVIVQADLQSVAVLQSW